MTQKLETSVLKPKWILALMALWLCAQVIGKKQCPLNYTLNEDTESCWYFEATGKSWNNAKVSCEDNGGQLGILSGPSDRDFIWSRWGDSKYIWLGVNDLDELGVHKDAYNNPIPWTDFRSANQAAANGERCILMDTYDQGGWHDWPCSNIKASVCMSAADEVGTLYHWTSNKSAVYRDEIATFNTIPRSCSVLCSSTPKCVSFARNGTICKLLKTGVTPRAFLEWDLFHS